MNKENRCIDCDRDMVLREGWLDIDGEYRHVEYFYCSHCDSIYSLDGELLLKSNRLVLTSDRK